RGLYGGDPAARSLEAQDGRPGQEFDAICRRFRRQVADEECGIEVAVLGEVDGAPDAVLEPRHASARGGGVELLGGEAVLAEQRRFVATLLESLVAPVDEEETVLSVRAR